MLGLLYDVHGNLPALEAVLEDAASVRIDAWLLGGDYALEGVLRDWHKHGDEWLDVNVFGLLRDDWAAGPLAQVPVAVEGAPPPAFR